MTIHRPICFRFSHITGEFAFICRITFTHFRTTCSCAFPMNHILRISKFVKGIFS